MFLFVMATIFFMPRSPAQRAAASQMRREPGRVILRMAMAASSVTWDSTPVYRPSVASRKQAQSSRLPGVSLS